MTQEKENPDRLPGWRRLYLELSERQLRPGDFVSIDWVHEQLGIKKEQVKSLDDATRFHLTELRGRKAFDRLRRDHQIALLWQRNPDGWHVPQAQQQLDHAQIVMTEGIRKEFRRAADWMTNVDTLQLTEAQRAAHAEKLAKLAHLRSMTRVQLRQLPSPGQT